MTTNDLTVYALKSNLNNTLVDRKMNRTVIAVLAIIILGVCFLEVKYYVGFALFVTIALLLLSSYIWEKNSLYRIIFGNFAICFTYGICLALFMCISLYHITKRGMLFFSSFAVVFIVSVIIGIMYVLYEIKHLHEELSSKMKKYGIVYDIICTTVILISAAFIKKVLSLPVLSMVTAISYVQMACLMPITLKTLIQYIICKQYSVELK